MAVDMFLKLGSVKGESTDDKHKDSIQVLAWSWGLSQHGSLHTGGGGGAGKAAVQDLTLTKYVDKSSHALIEACQTGKHFPEGKLTARKAGDTPLEYIRLTLTNVLVTSVSTGGSGAEEQFTENVTLNFSKYKFEYTPQGPKGAGEPPVTFSYNIPANSKEG